MSPDDAKEVVLLQEGLNGGITVEMGAATWRVWHEIQLQELEEYKTAVGNYSYITIWWNLTLWIRT